MIIATKSMQIRAIRKLFSSFSSIEQINAQSMKIPKRFRSGVEFKSGAIKPKPTESPLGPLLVLGAVIPGLFIGAQISKSVANFLEENDLFVPDDDDEDD